MAAEEVLLARRAEAARAARRPGGRTVDGQSRGLRPAARKNLRRDRRRSAQHAQVPGHGAAAVAARARRRPATSSWSRSIAGRLQRARRVAVRRRSTPRIAGLAQFAGARPPKELTEALAAIATAVRCAQKRFDSRERRGRAAAAADRASRRSRRLRGLLRADATRRERRASRSSSGCARRNASSSRPFFSPSGMRVEALADDGVVVPGQPVRVSVIVANRGRPTSRSSRSGSTASTANADLRADGRLTRRRRARPRRRGGADPPAGAPLSTLAAIRWRGATRTCACPPDARVSEPYWHREGEAGRYTFDDDAPFGLPYRPTPFYAQVTFGLRGRRDGGGHRRPAGSDIATRRHFSGEKRSELLVVPAVSVRISPEVAIMPRRRSLRPRPARDRATPPGAQDAAPPRPAALPAARPRPRRLSRAAGARRRRRRRLCLRRATSASRSSTTRRARRSSVVTLDAAGGLVVRRRPAGGDVHARRRIADGAVSGAAGAGAKPGDIASRRPRSRAAEFTRGYQVDRIPAHPPAAHLHDARRDDQGHRREGRAEPDRRLHHGRRRRGACRHRTARRQGGDARGRGSGVGQPVAVSRRS